MQILRRRPTAVRIRIPRCSPHRRRCRGLRNHARPTGPRAVSTVGPAGRRRPTKTSKLEFTEAAARPSGQRQRHVGGLQRRPPLAEGGRYAPPGGHMLLTCIPPTSWQDASPTSWLDASQTSWQDAEILGFLVASFPWSSRSSRHVLVAEVVYSASRTRLPWLALYFFDCRRNLTAPTSNSEGMP